MVLLVFWQALFTVYDGHGKEGDLCAVFCKETLPGVLSKELRESRTVEDALKRAFTNTNEQVRGNSDACVLMVMVFVMMCWR